MSILQTVYQRNGECSAPHDMGNLFGLINCRKALRCRHCSTWQDGREDGTMSHESGREGLQDDVPTDIGGSF